MMLSNSNALKVMHMTISYHFCSLCNKNYVSFGNIYFVATATQAYEMHSILLLRVVGKQAHAVTSNFLVHYLTGNINQQ